MMPVLSLLQGNLLLVGVGGSGKQSLSRLGAYTSGCDVFEITLTRGYDEISFREDLKKLYGRWLSSCYQIITLVIQTHACPTTRLPYCSMAHPSTALPVLTSSAPLLVCFSSHYESCVPFPLMYCSLIC